jgi:hypothetical protein
MKENMREFHALCVRFTPPKTQASGANKADERIFLRWHE